MTATTPSMAPTGHAIDFDTQGPNVTLELIAPAVGCGAQLTPASDANPSLPGVQIVARVISPAAAQRRLELRNTDGTATFNATNDVSLTVVAASTACLELRSTSTGTRTRPRAATSR